PSAELTAVDTSPAALAVARENARRHGVDDRIAFLESDLLKALPPGPHFDLIASNPPYVSQSEYESLAPEVRDHEPRAALLAGPDGLDIIERLIPQAAEHLHPGGYLLLEISPMIHQPVLGLFAADQRLAEAQTVKDLARHPRVVWAERK
ncbi:MAG: HemK family protein methyltransferase, partial [Pirellulales bacterium]|nr:HemK family protein methyltransferase [Pirellulales bacterium]